MSKRTKSTCLFAFILAASACDRGASRNATQEEATQPAPAVEPTKAAPENEAREEEHDEENVAQEQAAEGTLTSPISVGQEPTEELELIDVADIVANPQQYAGQTVRVLGRVKGLCVHARAWFALDAPGASPPYIRVITAPAFRVPQGAMDSVATLNGTVELLTLPANRVQHFEEHHQLGAGDDVPGTEATRPIIRATWATFSPPSGPAGGTSANDSASSN